MSALLVTGGAGFIGSNFVHTLAADGGADCIVVLDALTYAGNLANIRDVIEGERIAFEHGDIRNRNTVDAVFERYAIDRVVHFAAESHVDRSIHEPGTFVETNVGGTLNLLLAARSHWGDGGNGRRFLHVSTDEVFGSLAPDEPPFDETAPYAPSSAYAASKAAADHLVRAWHRTYDFPAIITNCSNNYGPRQFPEKLIPLMIIHAIEGRRMPGYGATDGASCHRPARPRSPLRYRRHQDRARARLAAAHHFGDRARPSVRLASTEPRLGRRHRLRTVSALLRPPVRPPAGVRAVMGIGWGGDIGGRGNGSQRDRSPNVTSIRSPL